MHNYLLMILHHFMLFLKHMLVIEFDFVDDQQSSLLLYFELICDALMKLMQHMKGECHKI